MDIKERAWDAADWLRFAAISAIPLSGVSAIVELCIVGIVASFSLDPYNVLVNVVVSIALHKLLQLLQLGLRSIGEMEFVNEFLEIPLCDLVVDGAEHLEVVLLHLDGSIEVPRDKGVPKSNE